MNNSLLYYSVGALLYCPANRKNIAASIAGQRFGTKYSLAMCLEDTIRDDCVAEAEHILTDFTAQARCPCAGKRILYAQNFCARAQRPTDWQTA